MNLTVAKNFTHDQTTKEVGFSNSLNSAKMENNYSRPSSPTYNREEMQRINQAKREYLEQYNFQYCINASKYALLLKIGQGTFG